MSLIIEDWKRLPKDLVVFYCWQDHLDKKLHRFLIRDAINGAIKRVQDELPDEADCVLRQDSDTSGRAGSVEIADTILQKISSSSIIIGDVTPVLFHEIGYGYPNPNVMLEIGFGARAIGWNRVICVYNAVNAKGNIKPESLPFDIRHRRLTPYSCRDASGKAQSMKDLEGKLVVSLRAVLQEIGGGVVDPALGNSALKRARDIELLKQLLQTIHRNTMDHIIERGSVARVHYDGIPFLDSFTAVVNATQFRLYDKKLEVLARDLHKAWETAVHLGGTLLYPGNTPGSYVPLPERQWDKRYERMMKEMGKAYAKLPIVLKAFLDYVHTEYPEIDMKLTDRAAWDAHLPHMNAVKPSASQERPAKTPAKIPIAKSASTTTKKATGKIKQAKKPSKT